MENYIDLRLGDAIEELKKIPDNSISLVLTDPPYMVARKRKFTRGKSKSVSLDFGEWDYFDSMEHYLKWCDLWIKECFRVLKEDGHLFVFQAKDTPLNPIIENNGFEVRNILVWAKSNPVPQFQKVSFLSAMEFGTWATKKGSKRKNQTFNFTLQKEMHNIQYDRLEEMSREELIETIHKIIDKNVIDDEKNEVFINEDGLQIYKSSVVMGKERTSHPTQKPLSLTKKLISIFTNEGDVILDCFCGSGTTPTAAKMMNRSAIGIEKSEEYHLIEKERIDKCEWGEAL